MSELTQRMVVRFPQLSLPIAEGMSKSEDYQNIVRRGILPSEPKDPFFGTERDRFYREETPVGPVEVLCLGDRRDFIRFVQALVYRCEPVPVPDSMGAVTVLGLSNWHKIRAHRREWLASHLGESWGEEFRRFTAEPANYRESVLLVSEGPYSAVPAEELGFDPEDWLARSLRLRIGHELCHLVSRGLWPENKQAVRDEITADCIGLLFAFGDYSPALAARLLGKKGNRYLPGGRLQNYLDGQMPDEALLSSVDRQIARLAEAWRASSEEPFVFLKTLEENRIGLEHFL